MQSVAHPLVTAGSWMGADQLIAPANNSYDQGQPIKEAMESGLRGAAGKIGGRKTAEDKPRLEVRQRLAAYLIT